MQKCPHIAYRMAPTAKRFDFIHSGQKCIAGRDGKSFRSKPLKPHLYPQLAAGAGMPVNPVCLDLT